MDANESGVKSGFFTEVDANTYKNGCEQFLNFFNAHTQHSHRQFLKDMAAVSAERFSIRNQFGEPQTAS